MTGISVTYNASEIRKLVKNWRHNDLTIAFVPTMGALHEGHLSLVSLASAKADKVVVSIFVNPAQFGPKEDFSEYPRDIDEDIRKLKGCGADAVFLPSESVIYPDGFASEINVTGISDRLCGAFRPHFFGGVATVCAVLFGIVRPDFAVFGWKDAQQLAVIRRMVKDLTFDIEIIAGMIIREKDGLAMSSRNRYLCREERIQACGIYNGLKQAAESRSSGIDNPEVLKQIAQEEFERYGLHEVQYLEIVDIDTMQPVTELDKKVLMCVAVFVGTTRLIDNIFLM